MVNDAMHETLLEVVDDYGPVIATDTERRTVVTVNGAYFNLWTQVAGDKWDNIDAYDVASRLDKDPEGTDPFNTLDGVTLHKLQNEAEKILSQRRNRSPEGV